MIIKKPLLWLILPAFFVSEAVMAQKTAERPNILFCIADDASYRHMSAYGMVDWVETPAFDRVAREGLLFVNAYTPNAKCAPSRACILTGRNPWQLEAAGNHNAIYPKKFITFMEVLDANGYAVGYTGKGWGPGDAGKINGKPRQLTGKRYSQVKIKEKPTRAVSELDYAANLQAFLDEKSDEQPFCFWYGATEPHRGYEYGSGVAKGGKKLSDIDVVPPFWIDNERVRNDMLDYAYEVEYFDYNLQKILDVLEKAGELDNTIVIVTSDNGMPFPRVKGHVYEFDNHLPLAIMWKNGIANPGRKIQDFVSFIDFAPTILEAAGVTARQGNMQPVEGESLIGILTSKKGSTVDRKRDHVLLGRERADIGRPHDWGYPVRGIVKDGFVYTINYEPERWPAGNPETGYLDTDGSPTKTVILQANRKGKHREIWELSFGKRPAEELYNIEKDPFCMVNLAKDEEFSTIKSKLRQQLENELKAQQDPRMFGKGYVFDEYPYGQPRVRNFYERFMNGEKMRTNWVNDSDFEKTEIKKH